MLKTRRRRRKCPLYRYTASYTASLFWQNYGSGFTVSRSSLMQYFHRTMGVNDETHYTKRQWHVFDQMVSVIWLFFSEHKFAYLYYNSKVVFRPALLSSVYSLVTNDGDVTGSARINHVFRFVPEKNSSATDIDQTLYNDRVGFPYIVCVNVIYQLVCLT